MVIVRLDSVRAKDLIIKIALAQIADDAMTKIAPRSTAIRPGRMIIIAPVNPRIKAIIRRVRIRSPRNMIAPKVAKSGAVKLTADTFASGVIDKA